MRVRYSFSSRRTGHIKNIRKQKKKIPVLINEIVETSDILLEILDARFIEETRNKEVEEKIKNNGKKIIYVINKADLVDLNSKVLEAVKLENYIFVSCKKGIGIHELREKIKREADKMELDRRIQVGVIGYPNTGKSSLINLLSKRSAAGTGSEAGFTKGIQKIRLSENIVLLDTPGLIPESEYSPIKAEFIARQAKFGARTSNTIRDPEMVVAELMKEYSRQIEGFYGIHANGNSEILIELLGRKKSFLKKGEKVDEDKTSRLIIKDWQEGRIRI